MNFDRKNLSEKALVDLYYELVKSRLVEEKMLILLRQGKLSKWFSGIGQEAISTGVTLASPVESYLLTAHRNLGVFTGRGIHLDKLIAQFQGKREGFTKGRDRSFHFGSQKHRIIGMISHLGAQLPVADGIALAGKLDGTNVPSVVFTGEGGTSEGDFHEALNLASVWDLPVLFVVENNKYSISTPSTDQFRIDNFKEKASAYAIEVVSADGNNVLDVYHTTKNALSSMKKNSRPILLEANTFRMRGHEESATNDFVSKSLLKEWAAKDPIENYEEFLLNEEIIDKLKISEIYEEIEEEIKQNLLNAEKYTAPEFNLETEEKDLYSTNLLTASVFPDFTSTENVRYIDAINEGLDQSLNKHENLILMGQDIAGFGGVFKVTQGLVEKYGDQRVRNTPLCESAVIGASLGLSIAGHKSVVEMQFADFVTCGFNQIVNNLAKTHFRWGQHADTVIRMPSGAGTSAGPFHSQSTEAWFYRVPGLKIVYPSNPFTAKGLLNAAIDDPNPVLYFEHKKLYRSIQQDVPKNRYTIELGKARIHKKGEDLCIITYGMGVHWSETILDKFPDYSIQIIDLQTLLPWDKKLTVQEVKTIGKALILTEDTLQGSICSDIATYLNEQCFEFLDAPVMTLGSENLPIPFSKNLEEGFLANSSLEKKIQQLIHY